MLRSSNFAYSSHDTNGRRLPPGLSTTDVNDFSTQEHFWTTGVRRNNRNWSRYLFYDIPEYLAEHSTLPPEDWPLQITETPTPEVLSIQPRQTARIEWKRVGQKSGKEKLIEDLLKRGLDESDFILIDDMSETCGSIQFKRPFHFKLLRMAGDCHLLDKFNSTGWRLHPYDGLFNYLHHDVFVKGFCVQGSRSKKRRQDYGSSTTDVAVNWAILEQIPSAITRLNRYTVKNMADFHKDNYQRFQSGLKCNQKLPCLKKTLYIDIDRGWIDFYDRHDLTRKAHIGQIRSKYEDDRIEYRQGYGEKCDFSSTYKLDEIYSLVRSRFIELSEEERCKSESESTEPQKMTEKNDKTLTPTTIISAAAKADDKNSDQADRTLVESGGLFNSPAAIHSASNDNKQVIDSVSKQSNLSHSAINLAPEIVHRETSIGLKSLSLTDCQNQVYPES